MTNKKETALEKLTRTFTHPEQFDLLKDYVDDLMNKQLYNIKSC